MKINLKKAVKVFHPNPSFVQTYFEAVANALDAGADRIVIDIKIDAYDKPDTLRINIDDNGQGFTDLDFKKFSHLLEVNSDDHKGLGRLVYLAYFSRVNVVSHFGGNQMRTFSFDSSFDEKSGHVEEVAQPTGTHLEFRNFIGTRLHSYDSVTPAGIRSALLQEFMPTFFERRKNGKPLSIVIKLDTATPNPDYGFVSGETQLSVSELPSFAVQNFHDQSLDFFQGIDIHYSIEQDLTKPKSLLTTVCVDGRAVPMDLVPLDALPPGHQMAFFFTSDYFIGKTNTSRQRLELPDELTERTLKSSLRREIGRIIADKVPAVVEQNQRTAKELDDKFPHLAGYYPKENAGLMIRATVLDEAQKAFFNEQKRVLDCETLDDDRYEVALELSARTLMEYVLYRARIIEKLKGTSPKGSEGAIHNLIVPTKRTLESSGWMDDAYTNNVWLLDDRYMSYSTVLSDQHMTELLSQVDPNTGKDIARPDIAIVFSGDPTTNANVNVVVVELKKQGLGLAKNEEVISQLRQRATALLKHFPDRIERMWFFGITEITPEFRLSMKNDGYRELFSHGQMFYKHQEIHVAENFPPYLVDLVVMDYEALIKDAEARNETFIRILRHRIAHFVADHT